MPFKISGTINTSATVYAVDMDSGIFIGSVNAVPPTYEIVASPFINGVSGTISVTAVTPDGESLSFSNIDPIEFAGDRAVFGGGSVLGSSNYNMYYITISTLSNASSFGEIRTGGNGPTSLNFQAGTSNGSYDRGLMGNGGYSLSVDYITISILGDSTFFGNLFSAIGSKVATSNKKGDRAIWMGGQSGSYFNYIDYNAISTLGEAQDFGDLTQACRNGVAFSNATGDRGVRAGGVYSSSHTNQTDYVTISTTGNASYFGTLTVSRGNLDGTSNDTGNRGLAAGGSTASTTYVNIIDYNTITTLANSSDFGDIEIEVQSMASCNNA